MILNEPRNQPASGLMAVSLARPDRTGIEAVASRGGFHMPPALVAAPRCRRRLRANYTEKHLGETIVRTARHRTGRGQRD